MDGIRTILGDPLPLPYKPNISNAPRVESARSDSVGERITSDKLSSLVKETMYNHPNPKPEFIKLKSRPNPIRRDKSKVHVNGNRHLDSVVDDKPPKKFGLIDFIETQIFTLKTLVELNELNPDELLVLQDIKYNLAKTIDQLSNDNLFKESNEDVDLQESFTVGNPTVASNIENTIIPKKSQNYRIFVNTIIIVGLFLVTSYIVSEWRYQYCYYFC